MDTEDLKLTPQHFRDASINTLIAKAERKECHHYSSLFFNEAKKAQKNAAKKLSVVYDLLGTITGLHLQSDSRKEPLTPNEAIDRIPAEDVNSLQECASEIEDAELRARAADLVWIRKRDHKMAELAVHSYIDSASTLEDADRWPPCFERTERAFRLSRSLGERSDTRPFVVDFIEKMLAKCNGEDPLFLSNRLMGLLCEHKIGDPTKYSALCEKAALKAETTRNWRMAEVHWQRKADWDSIAEDHDARKKSLVSAAETNVKIAQATAGGDRPGYMVASTYLRKAIEAYRRIGGMKGRVDEIHKLLVEFEQESLKEFAVISSPGVDLGEAIEAAKESVKGKNLLDALMALSLGFRVESKEVIRKQVEETARNAIFMHLMDAVVVNEKGKVVARKPGLFLKEGDDYEAALRPHMFERMKIAYSIDVQALIEPMRRQIESEHRITVEELRPIVLDNPFIPQHREYFCARGLVDGLKGDFLSAIHVLVPQFENSVRILLEQNGVTTSNIDENGIQQEYGLNELLYLEQTKTMFGDDLCFHLQGLLVEKAGANIRNRMAHGLMYAGDFYSPECVFLWALILRICCLPFIRSQSRPQQVDEQIEDSQAL